MGSTRLRETSLADPVTLPPSPTLLTATKSGPGAALVDVRPRPFVLTRAVTPHAASPWPDLTPSRGIAPSAWRDAGAIVDGVALWCYMIN